MSAGRHCLWLLAFCATRVGAVSSVTLPDWACAHPDAIFAHNFETAQLAAPSDPSHGSGGATGSVTRSVHVAGLGSGTQKYYLYVPANYTSTRAWPVVLALHGVAPYPDTYAEWTRDNWISTASAGEFIVAAPVAHDQVDVYGTPGVTWLVRPASPNDYDEFAAIRADLEAAYNIERTRVYGWGFSSGGHVMHDLGVNTYSTAFNASTMAAYGVSAGDLAGFACKSLTSLQCNELLAAVPRKIPVDVHIDISDPNYPYASSDHSRFLAQGWADGQTMFFVTYSNPSDPHNYTTAQLGQIWNNLCPYGVVP
jgi:hypothetical protein